MLIASIPGRTREIGRGQGFIPLPLRDNFYEQDGTDQQLHCMLTAWQPTPEELEKLIAGAPVILSVYGTMLPRGSTLIQHIRAGSGHPPVMLSVGSFPTEEELVS